MRVTPFAIKISVVNNHPSMHRCYQSSNVFFMELLSIDVSTCIGADQGSEAGLLLKHTFIQFVQYKLNTIEVR